MNMFSKPVPKPQLMPVQVPEVYGQCLELADVKAALSGQEDNPAVRAVIHLLMMRRTHASLTARAMAKNGKDSAFDLGGQDALDELFTDLHGLVNNAEPGDLVKEWFM